MAAFPYRHATVKLFLAVITVAMLVLVGWLLSLGFGCNTEVCEASIIEASTERSEKNQVEVNIMVCCVHKNLPNALFDQ